MSNIYVPSNKDKKIYKDISIVILTPCGSYSVWAKFAKCLVNLVAYSWMHGLKIYTMGITERMVVHWARNDLARKAKDIKNEYTGEKFTHILWLDDDHVFNPDMAVYLARHHDKDVVSALYFGRTQHLPVVYVKDKSPGKYNHYPLIVVPPNLFEVDAVGMGACLMQMSVLDRMKEPWFAFNNSGEDIHFCVHAKEQGIKIYCDGSYMLGHIGDSQIVTEKVYKKYLDDNEDKYGDRVKMVLQ